MIINTTVKIENTNALKSILEEKIERTRKRDVKILEKRGNKSGK